MEDAEIHEGDIGVDFIVDIVDQDGNVVDLTGATTLELCFLRPDGDPIQRTAVAVTPPGVDGKIHYLSVAGDLTPDGINWKLQGHVILPGGEEFHSTTETFIVKKNIC